MQRERERYTMGAMETENSLVYGMFFMFLNQLDFVLE